MFRLMTVLIVVRAIGRQCGCVLVQMWAVKLWCLGMVYSVLNRGPMNPCCLIAMRKCLSGLNIGLQLVWTLVTH